MTAFRRSLLHAGCTGGLLPRALVGLLAAVGTAMAVLVALFHDDAAVVIMALVAGSATGLGACLALPSSKKTAWAISHLADCRRDFRPRGGLSCQQS